MKNSKAMQSATLDEQTIIVVLSTGVYGVSREVNKAALRSEGLSEAATEGLRKADVAIFQAPEYAEIGAVVTRTRNWLSCKPGGIGAAKPDWLKGGMYVVSTAAVQQLEENLPAMKEQFDEAVNACWAAVEEIKKSDKARLGPHWSADLYPTEEEFREGCYWTLTYMSVNPPEQLRKIRSDIYERESKKAAEAWEAAAGEAVVLLRQEMGAMVTHALDRLTGKEDGKPKVFRDSLVENLKEWTENFPLRNVRGDADLAALTAKMRKLIDGTDAKGLRKDEALKAAVVKGFGDISKALDGMMGNKPSRRFNKSAGQ